MVEERKEEPAEVAQLREALAAIAAMDDDVACTAAVSQVLREWPEFGSELRQLREQRVNRLRERRGMTWPEIAAVIGGGITPERAQQISKGLSGAQRKKAKREAEEQAGK